MGIKCGHEDCETGLNKILSGPVVQGRGVEYYPRNGCFNYSGRYGLRAPGGRFRQC